MSKKQWIITVVIVLFVIGVFLPDSGSACETAYREDYVFYGDSDAMSLEDYCENFNDTSWLDEDEYNIGETYE